MRQQFEDYELSMSVLLDAIQYEVPWINNYMVSYLCQRMDCFIYIGVNIPSQEDSKNKEDDLDKDIRNAREVVECVSDLLILSNPEHNSEDQVPAPMYEIQIKLREKAKGENTDTLIKGRSGQGQAGGSRREKERIIGEVVIKVSEWGRLYMDQGVTLENAAQKIGISKKSLDDYFLQLRNG